LTGKLRKPKVIGGGKANEKEKEEAGALKMSSPKDGSGGIRAPSDPIMVVGVRYKALQRDGDIGEVVGLLGYRPPAQQFPERTLGGRSKRGGEGG